MITAGPIYPAVFVLFAAANASAAEPLRVMAFNLRGDFDEGRATDKPEAWISTTGHHRRDLVLRLVVDHDPDLLGVQEAYASQVTELDEALAGHDVYSVGRDDGKLAGEHCAIYYRRERFEEAAGGTFWLSHEPDRPSLHPDTQFYRIASWVLLKDRSRGGKELFVLNTHWDHQSAAAREHSGGLVRRKTAELACDRPQIVLGDLNTGEATAPLRTPLDAGEPLDSYRVVHPVRSERERTFHGFHGGDEGSRIDYVLHGPRLCASRATIVQTSVDGRYPSDHFPVTATLEYADVASD